MSNIYRTRQAALREFLQKQQVDLAFISSPTNIYYYTGFHADPHERFMALTLEANDTSARLFLPTLDEEAARNVATVDHFIPVSDTENGYDKLVQTLGDKVSGIAFEKNDVTVLQYEELLRVYKAATFINIEAFILDARKQKSKEEIRAVKKAIELTEKGLAIVLKQIKVGMTELEVKALLEYELTVLGSEGAAFDTTILTGKNSALPHGSAGNRMIQHGDFLLMDFGIYIDGYCSDITRTFVMGEASDKQREIYETVLTANEQAIEAVKRGAPLKNIDLAARKVIEEKGYGVYFTHRVGHGLGLDVHEYPSIHHENEAIINEGLLFTIEPGIYIPEFGGVRIEDDIYVQENGEVVVLTTYPKELTTI